MDVCVGRKREREGRMGMERDFKWSTVDSFFFTRALLREFREAP